MKVQFSSDAVRIRLPREAFDALCAGSALRLALPLAGSAGQVVLHRGPAFGAVAAEDGLHVTWPQAGLDALAARLPSREGLEATAQLAGRAVRFTLEVDVRSGRVARTPPAVAR